MVARVAIAAPGCVTFVQHAQLGLPRVRRDLSERIATLRIIEFERGIFGEDRIHLHAFVAPIAARGDGCDEELHRHRLASTAMPAHLARPILMLVAGQHDHVAEPLYSNS
jgi:hypothetical protein